jgi:hypothetical protein
MEVNLMASRLKAALFIILLLMSLSGCSNKTEDSIIKEEIVLNNTTGEIDLPHIERLHNDRKHRDAVMV